MLIGEGVEEVLFLKALLDNLGIRDVRVEPYDGKDGLRRYLRALTTRPGFAGLQTLCVVRDADDDPHAAASSLDNAIGSAGFPPSLTVKRLVLPGDGETGALENLCLRAIAGQAIETCLEDYMDCAARATRRAHTTTTHKAKARIQAWLAAQERPGLRLGEAAQKGLVDWSSPAFDPLKDFLRSLA
jgi:hypothetical protein